MLYDKRWEKTEVTSDPFKIETLIAWLKKQPANKTYDYVDCGACALAQYFAAYGFSEINMGSDDFDYGPGFNNFAVLPAGWDYHCKGWNTFGEALKRAEAFDLRRSNR